MSTFSPSIPSAKKMKLALPRSAPSSDQPLSLHLGFIGAGNMARSIVEGVIASGECTHCRMYSVRVLKCAFNTLSSGITIIFYYYDFSVQ